MAFIHVYQGTVSAGDISGTLVSEDTELSPISITVNATNNEESSAVTLAIRCETGYSTTGDVTITPTGTSASKWALSADNVTWQTYGSALTISSAIGATNTLFYAKAKAVDTEITPVNDTSVDLVVSATIMAV